VDVGLIPATQYALRGVSNTVDVLFQITTGSKGTSESRPPCAVSIVLDRSGSMKGPKLDNSKKAIGKMIETLSPGDAVHFAVYDNTAEVVFEKGDPVSQKEELLSKVAEVKDAGSTNLYDGLELGGKLLDRNKEPGTIRRVFIFSDGLANVGRTSKEQIFSLASSIQLQGSTVSSYGIGADFDEDMMKGIQQHGTGDYYFIENELAIEKLVDLGFQGLLTLIGTDASLKIRGKNGSILKKIFSHEDLIRGALLGDMRESNTVQILARMEVIPPASGEKSEILSWDLSYLPVGEKEPISISGTLEIEFTDNENLMQHKHPQVQVILVAQEVIESYKEVIPLVESGQFAQAIAIQTASIQKLKDVQHLDTTDQISDMLKSKEKGLEVLKTRNVKIARKKMGKEGYEDARMDKWAYAEHQ